MGLLLGLRRDDTINIWGNRGNSHTRTLLVPLIGDIRSLVVGT